jgi:aspartate racemase
MSSIPAIHTGILAHSPDGSALCYLTLIHKGHERFGTYGHADVTMDYIPIGPIMPSWDAGDYCAIRAILSRSVDRLKAAGAKFFMCPDNTAHIALEAPGPDLSLPGLNIADVVAKQALRDQRRCVAILGTRYTMEGPVYPRALSAAGIDYKVPTAEERHQINGIIFDELCSGKLTDRSRSIFVSIISRMKSEGCDAVALVCTEIPLLITPDSSPLPTLDSTRLLADEGFKVSTGEVALPTWHGGPVG